MATRVLLASRKLPVVTQIRHFHDTTILSYFVEAPRSNYPVKYDKPPKEPTILGHITGGFKAFKEETKLWIQEQKERLNSNFVADYPKEVKLWGFSKDPATLDKWVLTCDSDYEQGYSNCSLELSTEGTGIFSGNLDTRIPKDGQVKFAGYCNIKGVPKRRSFYRQETYNLYPYTHLVLRIRGDGRPYLLNLYCRGYHDILWHDTYHYPMFTSGGPYWQIVRIPFSKFVFNSKGVIQDDQTDLHPEKVTSFGITIADKVSGPFKLEIDYVGLELDREHFEKFAYELYDTQDLIK